MSSEPQPSFRVASLGRHSMIYGLGLLLTKSISFLMLPIYTRWLTLADYGVLQLLAMTFEVVTIIAGARIAWGIFHFYHKEDDPDKQRSVLSTALLLLVATYTAAAFAAGLMAPMIADLVFGDGAEYVGVIRLAAAALAFEGVILVPTAVFQLRDRSDLFVYFSVTKLVLQVILNLIFLVPLDMGVAGVILSRLITNGILGLFLAGRLIASIGLDFQPRVAKAFLRFGIPLVAMQVATFVLTFGDRYFLNKASSVAEVGLYGLAYQFGFLVATVGFAPVQRVWDPQRFAVAKRPDRDTIFANVFVYLNLLLITVALVVAVFAGDVLRVIATEPFLPAAAFVPLLCIAYVFQCWGNFLNIGIYVTERTEYFTLANWVAALVAVAGYMALIPRYAGWGATITTFVALAVRCWLSYAFSQRLWRVSYRWTPVIWLATIAFLFGILSLQLPPLGLPASLATRMALMLAYIVVVWIAPILTSTERAATIRVIRQRVAMLGKTQ